VKNLSKVYGKKESAFTALDDINFSIPDGATVAIIGKSGSGKSTLMHVMSGLDHATTGSVTINGKNIATLKSKAVDRFRATEMSFIFQAFFIEANQTCYQNVMLPLEIAKVGYRRRSGMVKEALEAVGLTEKMNVKASTLSGGQKQRLAIARSIVNKPKLIFADEPTGNLDSATGEKVIKKLMELNKTLGATLIVVTHDSDLASRCQIQINIKDGKITEIKNKGKVKTVAVSGRRVVQ
nr:ABC transporter ATP-binding protein [Candidatus Saccharibacteria bacterium]